MFDWLFEGRLTVYLLIGVIVLILLGMWIRNRRRGWQLAAGCVALLALVYLLLDRVVETRREQIERKLLAMASAVKKKDAGTIFQHISDSFQLGGQNKAAFRRYVEQAMNGGIVTDLTVWDFHFPDESGPGVQGGAPPHANVVFRAKPESTYIPPQSQFLVKAEFVRDGDGQWRLKGFQLFNPFVDTDRPFDIPPLPR